jgi:hypothetical protein
VWAFTLISQSIAPLIFCFSAGPFIDISQSRYLIGRAQAGALGFFFFAIVTLGSLKMEVRKKEQRFHFIA